MSDFTSAFSTMMQLGTEFQKQQMYKNEIDDQNRAKDFGTAYAAYQNTGDPNYLAQTWNKYHGDKFGQIQSIDQDPDNPGSYKMTTMSKDGQYTTTSQSKDNLNWLWMQSAGKSGQKAMIEHANHIDSLNKRGDVEFSNYQRRYGFDVGTPEHKLDMARKEESLAGARRDNAFNSQMDPLRVRSAISDTDVKENGVTRQRVVDPKTGKITEVTYDNAGREIGKRELTTADGGSYGKSDIQSDPGVVYKQHYDYYKNQGKTHEEADAFASDAVEMGRRSGQAAIWTRAYEDAEKFLQKDFDFKYADDTTKATMIKRRAESMIRSNPALKGFGLTGGATQPAPQTNFGTFSPGAMK